MVEGSTSNTARILHSYSSLNPTNLNIFKALNDTFLNSNKISVMKAVMQVNVV